MPNCDFYANSTDFQLIINFILKDLECKIYESYSDYEKPISEFHSFEELNDKYSILKNEMKNNVYLQIYNPKASKNLKFRKIELDPNKCDGFKFRYSCDGWGLIQLYLGKLENNILKNSHTNHNSEKRASKWENIHENSLGKIHEWDWKIVNSTSRKLNRFIKNQSKDKINSRYILPEAFKLLKSEAKFA
ncbi:hypothetical protein [Leptospira mtsangambouensis]|uniref:hypothetical protein n=1 Tax=Leptospira mtsangambouensis TaxID=2484912 RepID=UPI001EE9CB8F|nr:hypothetical protein [Leptospira mtsangambouensis]MCG6142730.1 hypothetical protein [Leptospira mtsangambouensis]